MQQKEEEETALRQRIDLLTQKIETLDEHILGLTEEFRESITARRKVESERTVEIVEEKEGDLPLPVESLEVDIFEEDEPKDEAAAGDVAEEEAGPAPKSLPIEILYNKAFAFYKNKDYRRAITEFDALLAVYPRTDYSDNALYWKGESYYSMAKYSDAIDEFSKVVDQYPEGNKAPDAQLKIGYSYIELKEKKNAGKAFQKVMDLYPFSNAAKVAVNKLNTL